MTNAELIKALRYHADATIHYCDGCPYRTIQKTNGMCLDSMISDAADALEAADKRIAVLEKSYSWKAYAALEESIEGYKTRIAELEAQLPKEGEWIDLSFGRDYKCSVCGEWYRMDGTPEQEDMNYCPNCGARMKGEKK